MNDVGVQNKHKQSNQSRSAFSTLESVIRQAESLSPTERLSLWQHLAQLPDSGIESTPDVRPLIRDHWMCLKTTSTSPPQDQEWEQLGFFGLQRKGNTVIATIDGVEVLRVAFKPKIFAEHLFVEILRTTKASIKKTDLARRLFERHANPCMTA